MRKFVFFLSIFLIISCFATYAQAAKAKPKTVEPEPVQEQFPPLEQMLGSMLMFGFRGMELNPDDSFSKLLANGCNVILFDKDVTSGGQRNIQSMEQLKKLTAQLRQTAPAPIFIGVDQEGGQVRRLKPQKGFLDLPSAQAMGQGNPTNTFNKAEELGKELKAAGINLDLAPVVDVDSNPYNPAIGRLGRAFSSDPAKVAEHGLAFGLGLAKAGVTPALKHFPGQGCAEKDTHLGATDISVCWEANTDLLPFAEIIRAGWPGMVMLGHLFKSDLDSEFPATLSRIIVTGLLRDGLGWQGVVISDDMQMKAITETQPLKEAIEKAVNAGVDILLFGNNLEWDPELPDKVWNSLRELCQEGRITEERVKESWKRIANLHAAYE